MKLTNPWVGYLNRSYRSIKLSITDRLRALTPEIEDLSDTNILMVIINIMAGITEMLSYYIDSMAQESFITTARKRSSLIKLTKLINYRVRASIGATVDLTFTIYEAPNVPVRLAINKVLTIPLGTVVVDDAGNQFTTLKQKDIPSNTSSVIIPAQQHSPVSSTALGVSTGVASISIPLPIAYEDGTLGVVINAVAWERVEDFGFSFPTSEHFIVDVSDQGLPYLIFGDGVNGKIPPTGLTIYGTYYTTLGRTGNFISSGALTTISTSIALPAQTPTITSLLVTNINYPAGGSDIEGVEAIRRNAPLSLRTLQRAVTRQDYIDIARLAPGIDKANLFFNCGKKVILYVAPVNGGIASQGLLDSTLDYFENKSMVTTFPTVKAAGETYIGLKILAKSKFRVNPLLAKMDIEDALIEAYSEAGSDINKAVRLSDIMALIDNLDKIDYLNIVYIYGVPYARPVNNVIQLDWVREILSESNERLTWKIAYSGGVFKIYKGGNYLQDLTVGVEFLAPGIFSFTINSSAGISSGDYWEIVTYPFNSDIVIDDYTVPRIHPYLQFVDITVNE